MNKRLISGLMATMLATALLSGCGGKEEATDSTANLNMEGYPITNEKITLTAMGAKQAIHGPWEDMRLCKDLEEKTNICFEFRTPPSTNYEEMKNIAFAGDDLPDIFLSGYLSASDEINNGLNGNLIPLEGLIDKYAPNIKEMFEKNPGLKASITTPDGHIYSLPEFNDGGGDNLVMWINYKWLDKLGITEVPTNTDELYDLLVRFRDEDPNGNGEKDEVPMTAINMFATREIAISWFGNTTASFEIKDGKVIYSPITENYRDYLTYMNKLYSEKLLDNEIYSQTNQQWTAKGKNNQAGISFQAAPFLFYEVDSANGEDAKYKALPPLTSPGNTTAVYPTSGDGIGKGVFAITKANKYPEATIRWVDYLYSEEGSIYANQLDFWKWTDDTKTEWVNKYPEGTEDTEKFRAANTPACGAPMPIWRRSEFSKLQSDPVNGFLNKVKEEIFKPAAVPALPNFYFTEVEQAVINEVHSNITVYVDQMEAKFISGLEPLSNWDKYIETIDSMGLDRVQKVYEAAYNRYKKAE